MYAFSNILSALLLRTKTGRGTRIDVSLLESLTEWMGYPLYYAFDGAPPPPRAAASHATIFPYGPFKAGDGRPVIFGLQNEREWELFCTQILGAASIATDPRFASNAKRAEHRASLTELIEARFASMSAEAVTEALDAAGIANGRMNDLAGLWTHAQLAGRGRWFEVATPAGPVPALAPPGTPRGVRPRMDPVPVLGQHTESVLAELGYDADAIRDLRRAGSI